LIKEARAAGYEGNLMVTADIVTPEAIEAAGADVMEGAYGEVASADTTLPTYKRFAKAYKEATGEAPYAFNANTYDATILVALAMIQVGGTDGASINEAFSAVANPPGTQCTSYEECMTALEDADDIDYEGASGPVNLDESGTASSPYSIQQVKNGEWTQIDFYPAEDFAAE
jgi:branched-chain amino acid transport system substrate-binding protein